jgi:hypothetical protein
MPAKNSKSKSAKKDELQSLIENKKNEAKALKKILDFIENSSNTNKST